jgi:hypothetical protein
MNDGISPESLRPETGMSGQGSDLVLYLLLIIVETYLLVLELNPLNGIFYPQAAVALGLFRDFPLSA